MNTNRGAEAQAAMRSSGCEPSVRGASPVLGEVLADIEVVTVLTIIGTVTISLIHSNLLSAAAKLEATFLTWRRPTLFTD